VRKVAVEVADGRPIGVREAPVGAPRALLERVADLSIGLHLLAAERRDLQEGDLPDLLRIAFEELAIRLEALEQPLAVVEPVDADDELPADEALHHPLHGRGVARLRGT